MLFRSILSEEKLKVMLDYFIDSDRVDTTQPLSIFISGGGEPTLTWDVTGYAIRYAAERAAEQGFTLTIYLMTNGSNLSDQIIDLIARYQVEVGVSFEILEEIQNTQRGHYQRVAQNIRTLLAHNIAPSISSVITSSNVHRMREMVEEVHQHFSGIRHLNFDPAMFPANFSSVADVDRFYADFMHEFFSAKELAGQYRITLDCNAVRKFEGFFPRYCQGKLCITPDAEISICHRISSYIPQGK